MDQVRALWEDVERIRVQSPLIHNITNFVVMNTTANALLSLGASPVMAHALEEASEMAGLAAALVINIGTLSPGWVEAMLEAGKEANRRGIPVVVDPVGAGATRFRTQTVHDLLAAIQPAVIRGNASEIRALFYSEQATKGVDSRHAAEEALAAALAVAEACRCVVCTSGATDLVVGSGHVIRVANGHPIMPRVTGLGCTASALIGAFAAVNPSPLLATAHAMAVMGIAGEIAAQHSPGPGSMQLQFLDALYLLKREDIETRLKIMED